MQAKDCLFNIMRGGQSPNVKAYCDVIDGICLLELGYEVCNLELDEGLPANIGGVYRSQE